MHTETNRRRHMRAFRSERAAGHPWPSARADDRLALRLHEQEIGRDDRTRVSGLTLEEWAVAVDFDQPCPLSSERLREAVARCNAEVGYYPERGAQLGA